MQTGASLDEAATKASPRERTSRFVGRFAVLFIVVLVGLSLFSTISSANHSWNSWLSDVAIGVAISTLFFWIDNEVRVVMQQVNTLAEDVTGIAGDVKSVSRSVSDVDGRLGEAVLAIDAASQAVSATDKQLNQTVRAVQEVARSVTDVDKKLDETSRVVQDVARSVSDVDSRLDQVVRDPSARGGPVEPESDFDRHSHR